MWLTILVPDTPKKVKRVGQANVHEVAIVLIEFQKKK